MMKKYTLLLLMLISGSEGAEESSSTSRSRDLLNMCIDSSTHKHKPGPESTLFEQCVPWKERSCCTEEVTETLHSKSLYNFNYNHCVEVQAMSSICLRHFTQDNCFYECSPNVGPWVVTEDRSWRKERFFQAPLCAFDCDAWFRDCANDYTCTNNWSLNFEWRDTSIGCPDGAPSCKINFCPPNSTCQTFRQIFGTAKHFCQTVWDGSWNYTSSDQCLRLWFDGSVGNPNDAVARHYFTLLSSSTASPISHWILLPLLSLVALIS